MLLDRLKSRLPSPAAWHSLGMIGKAGAALLGLWLLVVAVLGVYWSAEPDPFSVQEVTTQKLAGARPVAGAATAASLIMAAQTLLDKPGGFLSNDVSPPGVLLDNIPNWEFGVLVQVRDLSRAFRELQSLAVAVG